MPRTFSRRATIAAVLIPTLGLSACVTNEEDSTPEGWEEPHTSVVPEIAAMYDDNDGVLTAGTNPPYAPFQLKDSHGALQGVELDLARAVAGVLGLDFQPLEQEIEAQDTCYSAG